MSSLVYAIGDIHGRDDLLECLHEKIVAYHSVIYPGMNAVLIHIGDYIDGGPDSMKVIDRLIRGLPEFEVICLKGNHEDLMLRCLESSERDVWNNWLSNGGEATLNSFGVSLHFGGYDSQVLVEALGESRIAWLRSLPLYYRTEDFLFVHAGIVPGLPIEEQSENDLLWIRGRFLDSEEDHGVCVVHGHTPSDEPVVRFNRIGLDIGATSNGRLAAVVLARGKEPHFLSVEV